MSRPVLAGLVGYSADWLKRIELGQRGVSIPALVRLAHVLRVDDLSALIDGEVSIPVSAWDGPSHPQPTLPGRSLTLARSGTSGMPSRLMSAC